LNSRGQFSIIAALLVAVILIATVIATYSTIRNSPIRDQPQVLSAIDETNFAIKQILGFTVGYYGSVLQVTGNSSYAKSLAWSYLQTGLVNVANMHPEWGTSFNASNSYLQTYWFQNRSYSTGDLSVKYNLTGLGIYGITYETSCKLDAHVMNTTAINQARLNVTKDESEPVINLGKQNFKFYRYAQTSSSWEQISPSTEPVSFANGTYLIDIPSGIDPYSYLLQIEDPRGIIVVASSFSRYTCTMSWNSTLYSNQRDATLVAELLQNGTMRWLGQNLQLTTQTKPIPPIPVKSIRVNQTINNANREVPFQVEEWGSEYRSPLGMANNASVFSSRTMLVFLINPNVSKTTIWWNGSDAVVQTPYAYTNRYFTKDDPNDGILTNGNLSLILQTNYLYVDGFDGTNQSWSTTGAPPYLNDNSTNWISTNVNNREENWFSFRDLTSAQILTLSAIKSVNIEFECSRSGDDNFDFHINDGSTMYGPYTISPGGSSYGWKNYTLTSTLNTAAKINNAKLSVKYRVVGGTASTVSIRRCRLTIDFGGWLTSVMGTSSAKADFMRINRLSPSYGSNLAYIIHHGVVRDVIHQEAEWSGGIPNCPNVYSQIVITLPANVTYYTYQLRLMFVTSQQSRSVSDLNPIKLTASVGNPQTENGTSSGYPIVKNGTGSFYNYSTSCWKHHWSQIISGTKGIGIMFRDDPNRKLYVFDPIAGSKTGTLKANATDRTIQLLPVGGTSAQFTYALDVIWYGAVATFDAKTPIYREVSGNKTGMWIIVEQPPSIAVTTQS